MRARTLRTCAELTASRDAAGVASAARRPSPQLCRSSWRVLPQCSPMFAGGARRAVRASQLLAPRRALLGWHPRHARGVAGPQGRPVPPWTAKEIVPRPLLTTQKGWLKATPVAKGVDFKGIGMGPKPLVGHDDTVTKYNPEGTPHWCNAYQRQLWLHISPIGTNTEEWDNAFAAAGGEFDRFLGGNYSPTQQQVRLTSTALALLLLRAAGVWGPCVGKTSCGKSVSLLWPESHELRPGR